MQKKRSISIVVDLWDGRFDPDAGCSDPGKPDTVAVGSQCVDGENWVVAVPSRSCNMPTTVPAPAAADAVAD